MKRRAASSILKRKRVSASWALSFVALRSFRGAWRANYTPKLKARTALIEKLRDLFRRFDGKSVGRVIDVINPVLRGWVNYFAVGHSARCFSFLKDWVEKKVRRHMMRARQRKGFGWRRWSRQWLYDELGLFKGYNVSRGERWSTVVPAR